MAYSLNPNEIRFLQQVADNEEIGTISHLLRALTTGVDLTRDDLISIEDYLMDRAGEIDNEGLEVPQFFDAIRSIVARLVNSPSTSVEQPKGASPLGLTGMGAQQTADGRKPRKPRVAKEASEEPREPKQSKKEKYKEAEITPDSVPQYLIDIHAIINQVVDARLEEEIERRVTAEKKLEQLQKILKGL
jgi:hypothetical protein